MGGVMKHRQEDAAPYLVGAALAAVTLPTLVLGLSAPLWLGAGSALALLAGVVAVTRWRRSRETSHAAAGAFTPVQAALADADHALSVLDAVASGACAGSVRRHARRIAEAARIIVRGVDEDPHTLAGVQRVLTYYLPRAATLVDSYRILEQRGGHTERLVALEAVIGRLDAALQHYANRMADETLRLLDVELRLVDEALKDDLGG